MAETGSHEKELRVLLMINPFLQFFTPGIQSGAFITSVIQLSPR